MQQDYWILCVSGGLDSYVAWHYLDKPRTVFFDTGHKYAEKEKGVVQKLMPGTIIDKSLQLGGREHGDKAYIHCRNLLYAIQSCHYGSVIWMAGLQDDMVADKSPEAFQLFTSVISAISKKRVEVRSPFWLWDKARVVKWGKKHIGTNKMLQTTSCYHPTEHYCGCCPSCFRKWVAFKINGSDLGFYNEELKEDYLTRALEGEFVQDRNDNIIRAIRND